MLSDPLQLRIIENNDSAMVTSTNGQVATIDVSPGRTVRIGAISGMDGKATLSIGHTVSKENPGQSTDRVSTRLEVRRFDEELGKDVTAQWTLTGSSPRTGFTPTEVNDIARTLIGTFFGDADGTGNGTLLTRVQAGEP